VLLSVRLRHRCLLLAPMVVVLYTLLVAFVVLLVALGWFARGWWGHRRFDSQLAQARLALSTDRRAIETEFFEKASASGKPRGLRWVACDFHDGELLAFDRVSGEIYALRGVTVRFEAVAGGGMEDVEAVGNLRFATAVFFYRGKRWTTDGRVVFNLGPRETLEKFKASLTPLAD
jgi:hypothetical protein